MDIYTILQTPPVQLLLLAAIAVLCIMGWMWMRHGR